MISVSRQMHDHATIIMAQPLMNIININIVNTFHPL